MAYNKSGTFTYSPDVSVSISTIKNGVIDVSADIMNFQVQRNINAVSSFTMTLANPNRKYNRVINTMDRITVFLKRTKFVQVFTGYVTLAPIETLVPTPITVNAYCTLRNLQVTYWDDTLIEFQQLLLNYMDSVANSSNQTLNDGGIAQVIVNLLYKVAGWDPSRIHIAPIPQKFLDLAGTVSKNFDTYQSNLSQNTVDQISSILSAQSITSGKSISTNTIGGGNGYTYGATQTIKDTQAPDGGQGTAFTISRAVALKTISQGPGGKQYYPAQNNLNPVGQDGIKQDMYYCSVPFSYITSTDSAFVERAKTWIAHNPHADNGHQHRGRLLLLHNHKTGRIIVVRATSITEKLDSDGNIVEQNGQAVPEANVNYLQVHPGVVAYLNGAVGDPTKWNNNVAVDYAYISASWADQTQVSSPGPQPALEKAQKSNISSYLGIDPANSNTASVLTSASSELISVLRTQFGAMYSQDLAGPHYRETPNNPYTGKGGWFDCSGLIQWAYRQVGVRIGGNTWQQWGNGNNSDVNTHGLFIDKSQQPQVGDILFWNVPSDGGRPPQHVTVLSQAFDNTGRGAVIQSSTYGQPVGETIINWNDIKNGGEVPGWGMTYMGARRPLVLHPKWGQTLLAGLSVPSSSFFTDYSASSAAVGGDQILTATQGWNTQWASPNYNVAASTIQGTPRAFSLDNPLMQDLTQVIHAGLRSYMSAPNGDFVAWFPDYYGVYGTDPAIEISDVEIVDFQIYHNDDALTTHVAVIGDTAGIGQQVNIADFITTQGIVSIQDASTMQLLFGTLVNNNKTDASNAKIAIKFLERYGIRPLPQEVSVLHSHALEYFFALLTFMQQWANQFTSNIQLTYMPELYPGMRVLIKIDNESGGQDSYQFYCTQVTHQGDRSAGFTTQAVLTAPIKNGTMMHYGLDFVS